MGSQDRSKVHQFQRGAHCLLISQHWNRYLDYLLASDSIVETDYAEKTKVPVDRHILRGWIVRFPIHANQRITHGA